MAGLQIDIVTPTKLAFSGAAAGLQLPAWNGEMGILPGHEAVLTLVRGGVATVAAEGGSKRFVVGRGFAEIGPDRVTLLTDLCEAAESIDKAKAAAEAQRLEASLATLNGFDPSAEATEIALEVARARVTA
jgi:F-type H+-transporting ATPase subunit epsilon